MIKGANMDSYRRLSFDKPLLAVTLLLLIIGIVMVFSSSAVLAGVKYRQPLHFLVQQVIGAVTGLGLVAALLSVRRSFFRNPVVVYGLLLFSAALLLLCFAMPTVARTNRWIQLFGIRFQPSELAKISLVLFFAYFCSEKKERLNEAKTLIFPLSVLFVFIILIVMEPNYSMALFVAGLSAMMLFLGGVKLRYFAFLAAIGVALFTVYLFQASYRMDRIQGFISPDKDPLGHSFQVNQSKLAVGSGGLLGVSLGQSTQKLFFLPFAHTDFIFAILGEEVGLLGTTFTIVLFLIFLWRGLTIAFRTPDFRDKLIAAGLTLAVTAQALLNITVVLGLGPATGIPLPFISFGRSSLVCNLAAVGILLNVSQRKGESGGQT
jgi:cell division protein FtsW